MLLLFLLFEGLCCPGENTAAPQALQSYHLAAEEQLSFRMLQTSSFANHSWAHSEGSGWLGDLQTHGWDTVLGTIRFLKPWSHGNFSKQELKNLQSLFQLYFHSFIQIVQASAGQFQLELKPEAWLSCGPSPGPGRLQLVCHVSGFYPKPVWVMWMRGGYSIFLILICLTVIVTLVILVVVDSRLKKQSSNKNILSPHTPSPVFLMGANTQDTKNSRHQFCLAQVSWIKNRVLKKWKTRLNQLW
ncbi:T-cell surface glycoprotein CD1e, membrane-associated isoform X3 [Homo sapiens]|uniref:T-cell surface glycoprotein CD1e, membrane-associated isoform X3 n=1 Tax=Homo sapiens TaxID=9606 RepID=UPI001FB1780A|nr:T-cell surface glycoprotein CD1e, membrane-associated isoform X3 [Homo sapiens]XP_054195543.1 T-cell surface glycoprotein CD1e, membrane-associated isoform X3 [Homo sapiens]